MIVDRIMPHMSGLACASPVGRATRYLFQGLQEATLTHDQPVLWLARRTDQPVRCFQSTNLRSRLRRSMVGEDRGEPRKRIFVRPLQGLEPTGKKPSWPPFSPSATSPSFNTTAARRTPLRSSSCATSTREPSSTSPTTAGSLPADSARAKKRSPTPRPPPLRPARPSL